MYTDVHMPSVVPITDFRNNIFDYTAELLKYGGELEVEKNGQSIFKVVPIIDDTVQKAKNALKIIPQLAGIWKNMPDREFKELKNFFRGPKEKKYMKNLGRWSYAKSSY